MSVQQAGPKQQSPTQAKKVVPDFLIKQKESINESPGELIRHLQNESEMKSDTMVSWVKPNVYEMIILCVCLQVSNWSSEISDWLQCRATKPDPFDAFVGKMIHSMWIY